MSELIDREALLEKGDIEFCHVSRRGFYGPSRNPNDFRKSAGKSWRNPFNKYTAAEARAKNGPVVIIRKPKCKILADAPAVSVPEVKHGRWIWDKDGMDWNLGAWRCSECGNRNANLAGNGKINPYLFAGSQFCPSCGAKMDGETMKGDNK